jgi:uncharacterized coiled-coil DUF342 family protein
VSNTSEYKYKTVVDEYHRLAVDRAQRVIYLEKELDEAYEEIYRLKQKILKLELYHLRMDNESK